MMIESQNNALLEGTVLEAPSYSHENHSTRFFRFPLSISRLSGQRDILPILAPEPLLQEVIPGASLLIRGQLRSFNNPSGTGRRLVLTVFPQELRPGSGESHNQIFLTGSLCKPPLLRRTPLGRSICDLMLAVPRHYGRTDYLPAIAWGQLAADLGQRQVGEHLSLEGRIQSRTYQKVTDAGVEQRVAYEVSVMRLLDPQF